MKTALILAAAASAFADDCTIAQFTGLAGTALDPAGPFNICAKDLGVGFQELMNPNWIPKDAQSVVTFSKSDNCKKFFATVTTYMATIKAPCTLKQAGKSIPTNVASKISFDQAVADWTAYYNPTNAPTSAPTSAPTGKPTSVPSGTPSTAPIGKPTTSNPTGTPNSAPTGKPTVAPGPKPGSCTQVSVVGDATYCISGPICSGSGLLPAGTKCPKKGDAAVKDCNKYLPSASNGNCVAPVDAVCQKIPSGAFGCMWPSSKSPPAPIPPRSTPAAMPTPAGSTTAPVVTTGKPSVASATAAPTTAAKTLRA
ncbi:hypothetical protein THRCLA_03003 [Thraustotheca clavata]|uniref:Secreted protein n=1 Tax=Thraustotheca clavata TaxID=74557 RepID=A0A0A7CLS1_9STRA|nr:secreted protein [Thraustotheca clavata]OQS04781.1 hypothetical protein THRCLA_03003 [Thraustotheca clavata]